MAPLLQGLLHPPLLHTQLLLARKRSRQLWRAPRAQEALALALAGAEASASMLWPRSGLALLALCKPPQALVPWQAAAQRRAAETLSGRAAAQVASCSRQASSLPVAPSMGSWQERGALGYMNPEERRGGHTVTHTCLLRLKAPTAQVCVMQCRLSLCACMLHTATPSALGPRG